MNPIHILPLGNADRAIVDALRAPLRETFRTTVEVRDCALDIEQCFDEKRVQYNSSEIIRRIAASLADDARASHNIPKTLAVLPQDLFIPILTYVFGEAELGGSIAIASYHRLQTERYGLPPNREMLIDRITKEALHEVGHTHGLVHCHTQECVMRTSTYVEDIDLKGAGFCVECSERLFPQKHSKARH